MVNAEREGTADISAVPFSFLRGVVVWALLSYNNKESDRWNGN